MRAARAAAAVGALALAGVLTACSGSSAGSSAPSASGSGTTATSAPTASTVAPTTAAPSSGTASSSAAPAPTGPLSVVPTAPVSTAPAVPIDAPATVGGVTVSIGTVRSFTGTGVAPGELGGPAVAVPVTLRNTTSAPVSAQGVVVDLVLADGSPASPLSGSPASPVSGTVAPGATVSGVYAFTLAENARANVSITVSYRTGVPVAHFTGSVAS